MDDKKLDDILTRLQRLEDTVHSLIKSNDQVVLALIPYKVALEMLIRKGVIDAKELDKRANELLKQFKDGNYTK